MDVENNELRPPLLGKLQRFDSVSREPNLVAEVAQHFSEGGPYRFVVVDKKSQVDITRSILLQVIAEQEHGGEPLMSRDFLSQVIRSYGAGLRTAMGSYLEQSLKLFAGPDAGRGPQG